MARPKKDKSTADDKIVQVTYKDFMSMQNATGHALNVYHNMTTNAMQATSHQLSTINAAMLHVQTATKNHLAANKIETEGLDLADYPALAHILAIDKTAISNPLGNVLADYQPITLPSKLPEAIPVKTRKPRKPKDPNAPKRPLTGYLFYYHENKEQLQQKLNKEIGGHVTKGRVQLEGKNVWNSMPEKEKEEWKRRYREKWAQYQEALKEYLAKGGHVDPTELTEAAPDPTVAGEDDEADDDDDDDDSELVDAAPAAAPAAKAGAAEDDDEDDDDDDEEEEVAAPPAKKPAAKAKPTPKADKKEPASEKKKKAAAATTTPKKTKKDKDADKEAAAEPASSKKRKAPAAAVKDDDKKTKKRKSTAAAGAGADTPADKASAKKKR